MSRKIRHTLCKDRMYDIDMKNAHPTLLTYFCCKNGVECSGLENYNKNREPYLAEVMKVRGLSRDEAKTLFLAILNGKKVEIEEDDTEGYADFYNGMLSL